jgi:hypothetical protein
MLACAVLVECVWPGRASLGLWVLVIWLMPTTIQLRHDSLRLSVQEGVVRQGFLHERKRADAAERRLDEVHRELASATAQIEELKGFLIQAGLDYAALEIELEEARSLAQQHGAGHPLFRRVGLDPKCPKFVAEAVRRSYRKRLHPDTKPPHQKAEAERRFKEAETVFDQIWRARNF